MNQPPRRLIEHIDVFDAVVPAGQTPSNQDGEVERFEALARRGLIERLHADAFTLEAAWILARTLAREGGSQRD